jgi:hypothetical protein
VTNGERAELIARYRGGYGALQAALDGLDPVELD